MPISPRGRVQGAPEAPAGLDQSTPAERRVASRLVGDGPVRRRNDPRRERTPRKLLAAARVIFERDGFFDARLVDITDGAEVASGTLYRYFGSKHEIFAAVMEEVVSEITAASPDADSRTGDPVARLREVNRAYVRAIRRNAKLMNLMYQVSPIDEAVAEQGAAIADHLQERAVRALRRWQADGIADPSLDPVLTAHALTFMVERVGMAWMAGRAEYDESAMVDTINLIWERALGLGRDWSAPSAT